MAGLRTAAVALTLMLAGCAVPDDSTRDWPTAGDVLPDDLATLLRPEVGLAAGETEDTWWYYHAAEESLVLGTDELELSWRDRDGAPLDEQVSLEADTPEPGFTTFHLTMEPGIVLIDVTRRSAETDLRRTELGLLSSDTEAFVTAASSFRIESLFLDAASGEPLLGGDGATQAALAAHAQELYGFLLGGSMSFLEYVFEAELLPAVCLGGAATDGPTAPLEARHNDNYCGVSTFIHSMETTFPGSLPENVTTNRLYWDDVAENLDHSNTFGIRGCKMVKNINQNYGDDTPESSDRKRYCAGEIDDTSIANLAAWAEDCDVKLLVFDLPEFGHWVDVNQVDLAAGTLEIQDYGDRYNVSYDGDAEDITVPRGNGPLAEEFGGEVAGDGLDEWVDFYVVCECDLSGSEPSLPKQTQSGKALTP